MTRTQNWVKVNMTRQRTATMDSFQTGSMSGSLSSGLTVKININDVLVAAEKNDVAFVEELLNNPSRKRLAYPATWKNNDTPLHRAAAGDQIDVFQMLWPLLNCLVENENGDQMGVIHLAAQNNACQVVAFLIGKRRQLIERKGGQYGRTPMHFAAEKGHEQMVDLLLQLGAKVSSHSESVDPKHIPAPYPHATKPFTFDLRSWNQPINLAAYNGHVHVVAKLDALRHLTSHKGATAYPIHSAILGGQTAVVDYYLSRGLVSVDLKEGTFSRTLIHLASERGHLEMVEQLVHRYKTGFPSNSTDPEHSKRFKALIQPKSNEAEYLALPIHMAAYYGHLQVVDYYLSNDPKLLEKGKDSEGSRAIHWAAYGGQIAMFDYFVKNQGVADDLRNNLGQTPIVMAAYNGHLGMVEHCLQISPQLVFDTDRCGRTPLHWAAIRGHLDIVTSLVTKYKANVYAKCHANRNKALPIHYAADEGHLAVVDFLLQVQPDLINVKDSEGNRPIHEAALNGCSDVVDYFLSKREVNVELRQDRFGRTPLHYAAERGHLELVKMLVSKYKADVYAKSNKGDCQMLPIHLAAWQGRLDVVQFLVEKFPDLVNAGDTSGDTPLKWAAISGNLNEAPQVVGLLRSLNAKE